MFSGALKYYSSEPLNGSGACLTVLLKPVLKVWNADPMVSTATVNSTHISNSADKKIRQTRSMLLQSCFTILCFTILFYGWLCSKSAETQIRSEGVDQIKDADMLLSFV